MSTMSIALADRLTDLHADRGQKFLSVPLPFASILRDRFLATEAHGEAELDFAVISRRAAEDAGL